MIKIKGFLWPPMPKPIFVFLTLLVTSALLADVEGEEEGQKPYNTYVPDEFPLPVILTSFETWAEDNKWNNTWTAYPKTGEEVVSAANWAHKFRGGCRKGNQSYSCPVRRWELRASGEMHTWSPLTFPNSEPVSYGEKRNNVTDGRRWPIVNLKTKYLNSFGIISKEPGNLSFWAQPGISMEDLLTKLEENRMGLGHHPAPGVLSLGGVLAIGGHGACTKAVDEKLIPGHTHGSVSNLIVSLTAVLFDKKEKKFVLKTFHRSHPDAKAFLVNLGRTFVVNVTMRAAPLQYMRCQSYTRFTENELFAHPDERRRNSFSKFLDQTGRVEAIFFPFVSRGWLKTWSVVKDPERLPWSMRFSSRKVDAPYNYIFSDNINPTVARQVELLKTTQNDALAVTIGTATYATVVSGLTATGTWDIWGASKNVMLYLKPTTLRYHANGYSIITSRADVQLILHQSYRSFKDLVDKFRADGKFPINGALEVRVTGLDDASDVNVEGAESPSISASSPVNDHPEFDTVVWFDVLTYTRTAHTCHFMKALEDKFIEKFDGSKATFRPEWSKGWSYTDKQPWDDLDFLVRRIPNVFGQENWKLFKNVTRFYGQGVFNNQFMEQQLRLY